MVARSSLKLSFSSLVLIAVLASGLLSSRVALADRQGPGFSAFAQQIREIQQFCHWTSVISSCAEMDVIVEEVPVSALAPGVSGRLSEIVLDQVNVWGDTILEGDLVLRSDAAIARFEVVKKAGQTVAFRVIYQAHAYDSLESQEGFIGEAAWIHPALGLWFRDDRFLAHFVRH